jgi:hypothetical protein
MNAPDPHRQQELEFKSLLALDPAAAGCYQQAARLLIEARTGEKKIKYRKLLLSDGEPLKDPPAA